MYNLAISPEVENFQMKIYHLARDRTPDPLNQRQTCYHQSQRGGLYIYIYVCVCVCVCDLIMKFNQFLYITQFQHYECSVMPEKIKTPMHKILYKLQR